MTAVAAALLLVLAASSALAADWKKPEFCKDWDCPKFEEVRGCRVVQGQPERPLDPPLPSKARRRLKAAHKHCAAGQ
jgi:opacity protein-like surface antigen